MAKKKEEALKPSNVITDSTITVNASANEHTRAAVEALANAAAANARAIEAAANALKGGDATGIKIVN